jgi:hypothetical protein
MGFPWWGLWWCGTLDPQSCNQHVPVSSLCWRVPMTVVERRRERVWYAPSIILTILVTDSLAYLSLLSSSNPVHNRSRVLLFPLIFPIMIYFYFKKIMKYFYPPYVNFFLFDDRSFSRYWNSNYFISIKYINSKYF